MRKVVIGVVVGAVLLCLGCASTPYDLHDGLETDLTLKLREAEPQIERGRPNAWLDGFGHYFFSLPSKLILLRWRLNNHDVSPEVETALQDYLWANGLCNTKVRLNQYAPGAEWSRLFRNREMPAGWRYTIGVLSVSFYTIFPDRLFAGFPIIGGGDSFNPYTNTLHVYSDLRPVALHEGGHAKDLAEIEGRHWKGLYSGFRSIPILGLPLALWQEADASSDALSWELATGDAGDSKAAYRTLYPAYGTYLGGSAHLGASFFLDEAWILYAAQYGVVVAGHLAGQTRALFVRARDEGLEPEILPPVPSGAPVVAPDETEPEAPSIEEEMARPGCAS